MTMTAKVLMRAYHVLPGGAGLSEGPVAYRSRSLGFITLGPMMWAALAAGVVILGMSIALKVQSARLETRTQELATEKAAFATFKAETKRLGDEAKAKALAEVKRQKEVSDASAKSYQSRLASLHAAYRGLRDSRADPGSRPMPPVPNAPVCPDGTASRDQLLAVLRSADEQTVRLQALQEWVRAQEAVKP